jgi:molybdopterin-containing oxidoreductase family iron-sulfur binding subunit
LRTGVEAFEPSFHVRQHAQSALAFGDLADKKSSVVKAKASPRDYQVLKYIGTRPRTSYLARLRTPNKNMPGAENIAVWSNNQY